MTDWKSVHDLMMHQDCPPQGNMAARMKIVDRNAMKFNEANKHWNEHKMER
jgi:hypothetical protein